MWMITPAREIQLLHAVQQPLLAPELLSLRVLRDLNATFTYIGAVVPVNGQSTAKLDLLASWQETIDGPCPDRPTALRTGGQ